MNRKNSLLLAGLMLLDTSCASRVEAFSPKKLVPGFIQPIALLKEGNHDMSTDSCKIITGVVLILKRDNKILLFKRNIPGKIACGCFALPGGTVEHHETVKHAACREALEEIGITITENNLSPVHMLRLREKYDKTTNQTEQILILYFMETSCWEGQPTNLEPNKHSELAWFEVDNLPQNTFPLNLLALDDIRNGKFYGEHGWL